MALLLQWDIDKMYSWTTNLLLRFHPNKCYSTNICSKSKEHRHHSCKLNNKDLKSKSEIKDLGIIVDENFRFSNHITEITDKVNKAN